MPIYSKILKLDLEKLKDRLLFEEGIKHFRFLRRGKSLILALQMTEFRSHIRFDEPTLYIPPMNIHEATFVLQPDRILVKAKNPENAEELINLFLSRHLPEYALRKGEDLKELIKSHEDSHLEFKSSLRYDIHERSISKNVEKASLKTICAFLNTEGGKLVIGISDEKEILGLSMDFKTFKRKNRDGFENHLLNLVSAKLGDGFLKSIKTEFHEIKSKTICIIRVLPSDKAAFLKEKGDQEFYVRIGNSSRPFSMSEATAYIKKHWK